MTGRTKADLLSLADFQARLADQLAQAESVLRKLNTEVQASPPALGWLTEDGMVWQGGRAARPPVSGTGD